MTSDSQQKRARVPAHQRDLQAGPPRGKLQRSLESIAWVVVALGLAYYMELLDAVRSHAQGTWFYVAAVSMVGFLSVFLYLEVYLPRTRHGRRADYKNWESDVPNSIRLATALGVVASISSNAMLWPAYGMLTPVLSFLWFMGITAFISFF
ncbi:hypothetical protein BC831DRAFT_472572 [Entophlyctis helioformis]|nr:hypothetical protein BC831DRAFT_472572 [Entophlyctis helioformis]